MRSATIGNRGRTVGFRTDDGVELVEVASLRRQAIQIADVSDFACVGSDLWIIADRQLHVYRLQTLRERCPPIQLPGPRSDWTAGRLSVNEGVAVWCAPDRIYWLAAHPGGVEVLDVRGAGHGDVAFPLLGRQLVVMHAERIDLLDVSGTSRTLAHPNEGAPVTGAAIFSGRALACWYRHGGSDVCLVLRSNGQLIHRIPVATMQAISFAEPGMAMSYDGTSLFLVDLRFGRVRATVPSRTQVHGLELDPTGTAAVLNDAAGATIHVNLLELFGESSLPTSESLAERGSGDGPEPAPPPAGTQPAEDPQPMRIEHSATTAADVPAIGALIAERAPLGIQPYACNQDHLDDLWETVELRVRLALARRSGGESRQYRELLQELVQAERLLREKALVTHQAGVSLSMVELVHELALSLLESHALCVVVAPRFHPRMATHFASLSGVAPPGRCTRATLLEVLAGESTALRRELSHVLAPTSKLLADGYLRAEPMPLDLYLHEPLVPSELLIERICAAPPSEVRSARVLGQLS